MAKHQFQKGNTYGKSGRPRGSQGRFTSLKQSFLSAYAEIGGDKSLSEWAAKNKTKFYTLIAKMLPSRLENEPEPEPDLSALTDEQLLAILTEGIQDISPSKEN